MKKNNFKKISNKKLIVAAAASLLAMRLISPNITTVYSEGQGNCSSGYVYKDEHSQFSYSGNTTIGRVIVKAGSSHSTGGNQCTTLTQNGSNGCYSVMGLGTKNVTVTKVGSGHSCKDISHVEFYAAQVTPTQTPAPTQTPTPTSTPRPTQTPTPTNTPVPTGTPVSTATPSPTSTPVPTQTPSPTPNEEPTPTPSLEVTPTVAPTPGDNEEQDPTPTVTPEVTPTTTPNPDPTQTPTPGNSNNESQSSSGNNNNNSTSNSSNNNSTGEVLGATTLAATGIADKLLAQFATIIGSITTVISAYGIKKNRQEK